MGFDWPASSDELQINFTIYRNTPYHTLVDPVETDPQHCVIEVTLVTQLLQTCNICIHALRMALRAGPNACVCGVFVRFSAHDWSFEECVIPVQYHVLNF